jgi:hypothetical protein
MTSRFGGRGRARNNAEDWSAVVCMEDYVGGVRRC